MDWIEALEGVKKNESVNVSTYKTYKSNVANSLLWGDGAQNEIRNTGQDGPYSFLMDSPTVGVVNVVAYSDRAVVDGVVYALEEIRDLKTRGLSAADLREVHRVKKTFEGQVIPVADVEKIQSS